MAGEFTNDELCGVLGSIGRLHLANRQLAIENARLRAQVAYLTKDGADVTTEGVSEVGEPAAGRES